MRIWWGGGAGGLADKQKAATNRHTALETFTQITNSKEKQTYLNN